MLNFKFVQLQVINKLIDNKLVHMKNVNDISALYKSLSMIIHLKKYLIPQRPPVPINFGLQYKNLLRKQYPSIKKTQFDNIYQQKMKTGDSDLEKLKQKYEKQHLQFQNKIQEYQKLYIDPPKFFRKLNPYTYFVAKQFKLNGGKKMAISTVASMWNQLSEKEKENINAECEEQKQKLLPMYNKYILEHQIPVVRNVTANRLYNLVKSDEDPHYKELPAQQQLKYQKQAHQIKLQSNKAFNQFLKRWQITKTQLQNIKQICKGYEQQRKRKQNARKVKKSSKNAEQQLEDQTNDDQVSQ